MAELHVLRVFVGDGDRGGNLLGVFLGGAQVSDQGRQAVAVDLGYSETVFVEDATRGAVRIHTPGGELPFAGHPLVGTSWLLAEVGDRVDVLRPPAGEVPTWTEGDRTWIRGRPEWAPAFTLRRLASPAEVDAHPGAQEGELLQVWAWQDEAAGRVRVRVFPRALGIAEDEATGAAAVLLGAELGRPLTISQGVGSVIAVRPGPDGTIDIGGRTRLDQIRDHPLPGSGGRRPGTPARTNASRGGAVTDYSKHTDDELREGIEKVGEQEGRIAAEDSDAALDKAREQRAEMADELARRENRNPT